MSWLTPETITFLLQGIVVTILLTLTINILSLLVGVAVGTMRLSQRPFLYRFAGIYVDIFRNIPALVLIIFFAFAVPNIFPVEVQQGLFFNNVLAQWAGQITGLSLPYYGLASVTALTLNSSAYIAKLFRAGVGTIPQEHANYPPAGVPRRLSRHRHAAHSQHEKHRTRLLRRRPRLFLRNPNNHQQNLSCC
ncbi:MAG: ABC transporter permease subunit [Chloroflexi bacterium]|nr:ABC transporter permease subunit [Chloroflexota bacterium]